MADKNDENDRMMTIVDGVIVDDPEAAHYGTGSMVGRRVPMSNFDRDFHRKVEPSEKD